MSSLDNTLGAGESKGGWVVGRNQNSIQLVNAQNKVVEKVRCKVLDPTEANKTSPLETNGFAFRVTIKDKSGNDQTIRVLSSRAFDGMPFSKKADQQNYQKYIQDLGAWASNPTTEVPSTALSSQEPSGNKTEVTKAPTPQGFANKNEDFLNKS